MSVSEIMGITEMHGIWESKKPRKSAKCPGKRQDRATQEEALPLAGLCYC